MFRSAACRSVLRGGCSQSIGRERSAVCAHRQPYPIERVTERPRRPRASAVVGSSRGSRSKAECTRNLWGTIRGLTCAGADALGRLAPAGGFPRGGDIVTPRGAAQRKRWTDGRTKRRTRIIQTKTKSHLAALHTGGHLHHVGVQFARMGHSRAAARCRLRFPSAVSTRGTSRRRGPRFTVRLWGVSITMGVHCARRGCSHGGALSAPVATLGHHRRGRVGRALASSYVRGCR